MISEKDVRLSIVDIFGDLIHQGADGLTDDGAFLNLTQQHVLAISTDSFVSDIDFKPFWGTRYQAGQRAIKQNLSDLAAMGASPLGFTWSLELDTLWMKDVTAFSDFCKGAAATCREHGLMLLGGDLGSRNSGFGCHITIIGETKKPGLKRTNAHVGESLWISGQLGESHLGLRLIQDADNSNPFVTDEMFRNWTKTLTSIEQHQVQRHLNGHEEIKLGRKLTNIASSCIDISDGFALDLNRLCQASGVSATINGHTLRGKLDLDKPAEKDALLYGGENFVLLFTVPQQKEKDIEALCTQGFTLEKIGTITPQSEPLLLNYRGQSKELRPKGWDAFSE